MEMKWLLCVDPGGDKGHTGVVLLTYGPDTLPEVVGAWALPGGVAGVWDFELPKFDHAVVEHFINRNRFGADLSVVAAEGAIRTRLLQSGKPFTLQPAAGKNSMVPDKVLKGLGMWFTGDHHHDRTEAARHGLLWLKRQRHRPTLGLLAGQ